MSLVYSFRNEIERIQDEKMREFLVESLDCVPEFYENLKDFIEEQKTAFRYSLILAEEMDSSDIACDIIGVASLLQDVTRFKLVDGEIEEELIHPLSVRVALLPLQGIIGRDLFDNVMRVVESSHGFGSPIPQVEPEVNSPAQMWILPFANRLAKESA